VYEAEKVVSYPHLTQASIAASIKIPKKTHVLIVYCLYYKAMERLFFLHNLKHEETTVALRVLHFK